MYALIVLTLAVVGFVSAFLFYTLKTSGRPNASTSLDAFIRAEPISKTQNGRLSRNHHSLHTGKGRQVLVLFGTEYGFSEELANMLDQRLQKLATWSSRMWQSRLVNAKHHQHVQWERETVCFIVISTCGDGVAPTECRDFMTALQSYQQLLHHLHFSVLALGDRSYPHFCLAGLQLAQRLIELEARPVVPTSQVDGEDWTAIESWMENILKWMESEAAVEAAPELCFDYLNVAAILENNKFSFSRQNPFMATLKVKRLLTLVEDVFSDRETIHCEFDTTGSGLSWTPGDSLGIYPVNSLVLVDSILSRLALTGDELLPDIKPMYRGNGQLTVREALQWCYDIKHVTPSTLTALSHCLATSQQDSHVELTQLLADGCEEYVRSRGLMQVLGDWCPKNGTLSMSVETVNVLLQTLRPLQPRFYSISSAPSVDETVVSVTVAVVRYLIEGRQEEGVATTYLQDRLAVGKQCPVFISPNPDFRLPLDKTTPILLIGPGTGLAPFRAFIQDRALSGSQGKIHLYFGCRHPNKDFLYRQQLEGWETSGIVRLRVAFSRYCGRKQYVQDLLCEDASLIWTLIDKDGGVVYVCGDAGNMAPAVHRTLVTIIQQQGQLSTREANTYITHLEQAGRYKKDVWLS